MYGCCAQPDFKRFEGGVDHTANMLYTWDEKRNLTGVAVGIPCPSQVNELHYFVSGDYWTNARKHIREQLGNIYVLSLCEAAGDQNPLDLVRISKKNHEELAGWGAQEGEVWCNLDPERECDKIGRRIADAVTRGWDDAREQVRFSLPFHHDVQKISLPLRKVSKADYDEALAVFDRVKAEHSATNPVTTKECVRLLFEPLGVIDRWELQQKTDVYQFEAHFIRIGDTVITTNPFELFVEYAFRVRARCKADQVFMIQLANDVGGYLPTQVAVLGGSYSSKPASTRVGPEGGDQLVEEYIKQIDQL